LVQFSGRRQRQKYGRSIGHDLPEAESHSVPRSCMANVRAYLNFRSLVSLLSQYPLVSAAKRVGESASCVREPATSETRSSLARYLKIRTQLANSPAGCALPRAVYSDRLINRRLTISSQESSTPVKCASPCDCNPSDG
jgi:hypothetical protein